jgi:hypothetical protein
MMDAADGERRLLPLGSCYTAARREIVAAVQVVPQEGFEPPTHALRIPVPSFRPLILLGNFSERSSKMPECSFGVPN